MEINEVKNSRYKIEPIKMKNDGLIKSVQSPLPSNYGFFLMLIGSPGSGKTNLWLNLLKKTKKKNTYYKRFDKVYIFSNSLHTITQQIQLPEERLFNGISQLEETIEDIKKTDDKCLIVIDDCITDVKASDNYLIKLIYNRRHIGGSCSIILISQVYNRIPLAIRKCCTALILFKTGNKKELASVFEDQMNIEHEYYNKIINYVFADNIHDFLFYDCGTSSFYKCFNKLELTFS
jgi:Cdc6-like AAA superfamily ATPase